MVFDPTASASSSQTWVAMDAPRQDARRPAQQQLDQRRLDCRQGDRIPGHGDLAGGRIEPEVGALQHRSCGERWAALQGVDTGNQLGEVERLDEVVVGTAVEARDAVRRSVAGGEHEDRCAVAAFLASATTSIPVRSGMRQSSTATS